MGTRSSTEAIAAILEAFLDHQLAPELELVMRALAHEAFASAHRANTDISEPVAVRALTQRQLRERFGSYRHVSK